MPISLLVSIALAALLGTSAQTPPAPTSAPPRAPAGTPPSASSTSTTPADSPAVAKLHAWLDAFNSADRARIQQFADTHAPTLVARVNDDVGFRQRTGGFTLEKLVESSPARVVALLSERGGDGFGQLTIDVDPTPPHKVAGFEIRPVPRPPEFAIPRLSESGLGPAIDKVMTKTVAEDSFSGIVMVAKRDKVLHARALGMADRAAKRPVDLETRFRIGSMNKMFTAVAILQLAQAGKLKLDEPIGTYLTDYPNKTLASKVTVHHLLTHTGGTGDIFTPEYAAKRLETKTLADYVTLFGQRDLAFEPGSRWAYSNYGFILLGAIVERVSGQSYYDYTRDKVFGPAGMTRTGYEPESSAVPDLVVGYMREPGEAAWTPSTDTLPYRGTSAGGGYSTGGDLVRFANALLSHRLLNAEFTTLLLAGKVEMGGPGGPGPRGPGPGPGPRPGPGPGPAAGPGGPGPRTGPPPSAAPPMTMKYAYGFMDRTRDGRRSVGHNGGAPGQNGELTIYPDSGYIIVVLANLDPPAASRLAQFLENRLP